VLGTELPLRAVFDTPTVAGLAGHLGAGTTRPPLRRCAPEGPLPLSAAQFRLWFLYRLEGPAPTYNLPSAVRLTGPVDVFALTAALADVVERHETLRTVFPDREGVPSQVVLPAGPIALPVLDCEEEALEDRLEELASYPFDLANEAPLQAALLRLSAPGDSPPDHVLSLVIHHIASDEASDEPLLSDLDAAYDARRRGGAPQWEPLPVSYRDYTLWQRELLGDPADPASWGARQADYWRRTLGGIPEELRLPTDRLRPPVASFAGDTVSVELPGEVAAELQGLCRRSGVTPFMVAQASVAGLLTSLGAGTDIPLGVPTAGRDDDLLEGLVGFFVNTLVLRTDTSGDPTLGELLARIRDFDMAAYAHADLPFDSVVEALSPPRSPARHPLFQVMVSYQHRDAGPDDDVGAGGTGAKFDLSFDFMEADDGGIEASIEFATDLFDAETAEELGRRLVRLMTVWLVDSDRRLHSIDLLSAAERSLILGDRNGHTGPGGAETLAVLFEAQAERTPDAPALRTAERRLTFAELDREADRLAQRLAAAGARPERLVAVFLPRAEMVPAILAVARTGASYLPLDPDQVSERTGIVIQDARPVVVVTTAALLGASFLAGQPTMVLEDPAEEDHRKEASSTDHSGGGGLPANAAYVIYTSGSTGRPKGVVVTHAALSNLFRSHQRDLMAPAVEAAGGRRQRVAHVASFAFDSSLEPLIWLLDGHELCVVSDYRDPREVLAAIIRDQIDVLDVTPAYLAELDHLGVFEEGVRPGVVLVGGESTPPEQWSRLVALEGTVVRDLYGPTETTVDAYGWGPAGPVRIAGTTTYVLGDHLQLVPPGVAGELYVGGAGLARGYLNQVSLTAERFVADPFGPPGGRLYRTGDRARLRRDGALELLGRADDQVKIRGFRIEPGEIEAALASHPAVTAAAVVVREDRTERRLVGYAASPDADPSALRRWLAERLPSYMVPTAIVVLPGLPLSANNKIDKRALPIPDLPSGGRRRPTSAVQEILAGMIADLLDLEEIGVDDDFFALGGHSLLAVRLVGRIRSALGVEVPLRTVFDTPTVAGLAVFLEELLLEEPALSGRSGRPALRPLPPSPDGCCPLSAAQFRLWFLYRLEGPSPTYNIPLCTRFGGPLNVVALQQALSDVVERHETLRTVFPEAGFSNAGDSVAQVLPAGPVSLAVVDCGEDQLQARLEELGERAFDLAVETPLQAVLLRLGPENHVLSLVIHHIASDEASDGPLFADLDEAYRARCRDEAPAWPRLAVQYRDYARWQAELLGDGEDPDSLAARDIAFWRDALAGLPEELTLPTDRPRPARSSYAGGTVSCTVPADVVQRLTAVARAEAATVFMVAHAAVAGLLSRLGGGQDIPLGVPVAGRDDPLLAGLVGFFVNTLVLRTDLSGDPTLRELLRRVREADLAAFAHQELPFDRVVEAINPPRSPARHPLFQVMVSYQHGDDGDMDLGEREGEPVDTDGATAKFDLSFDFFESEQSELELVIEYATD
ncbi:MAG: amino acid adenylation domain-containing protein, partial [Acidimicrobiia bacterium]